MVNGNPNLAWSPREDLHKPLPCPECRLAGLGGAARVGNRRTTCNTCNNFAANSRRVSLKRLVEMFPEEYAQVRAKVEADLYVELVERYARETYGVSRETLYPQGVDNPEEPTPEEAWEAFTSSFSEQDQTGGWT